MLDAQQPARPYAGWSVLEFRRFLAAARRRRIARITEHRLTIGAMFDKGAADLLDAHLKMLGG